MNEIFETQKASIAAFCEKPNIRRLSLFGSRLNADAGPESDIDLIIEFDPARSRAHHHSCDGARDVCPPWRAAG